MKNAKTVILKPNYEGAQACRLNVSTRMFNYLKRAQNYGGFMRFSVDLYAENVQAVSYDDAHARAILLTRVFLTDKLPNV